MPGSTFLPAYQAATALLAPFAPLWLHWRAWQGQEDRGRIGERLGRAALARPDGPLAWLHGATSREALLLLPLVARLASRDFSIILSTGPMASAAAFEARLPARARHQYVPVDLPRSAARFLDHWRPQLAIIAGPDMRPNLLVATGRGGVPLVYVEAQWPTGHRASLRNATGVTGALLKRAEGCLARSETDAERFRAAGLADVRLAGSLAYDVQPHSVDVHDVAELTSRLGARPVWLADAVRPEEEPVVFAAHQRLKAEFPKLLTIIVPRQIARGAVLAQAARQAGLSVEARAAGPTRLAAEILIADTAGDEALFYRIAEIVFLGSSFGSAHGRNPIEAARLGRAILHGPDVGRFRDVYAALGAAQAAARVSDADTLARSLAILLADKARMRTMGRAAATVVETHAGAADRTIQMLEPHLAQAILAWSK